MKKTNAARIPSNWYTKPETRLNSLVDGRYRLLEYLGAGGYGIVYKTRDERTGEIFAIKIFFIAEGEAKVDKIKRMVIEMRALKETRDIDGFIHKADAGRIPAERPEDVSEKQANRIWRRMQNGTDYYYIMPLLQRHSLLELVSARKLTERRSIEIILAVGTAIATAHSRGLILRDIKHGNILFDEHNQPRIADLGTMRFLRKHKPQVGTPAHYMPLGTPLYIPPEAYNRQETVQRDVYALGVTFLEMLVGILDVPESHGTMTERIDVHVSAIERGVQRVSDERLREIIGRATAPNPNNRYKTMLAFVNDLRVYAGLPQLKNEVFAVVQHGRRLMARIPAPANLPSALMITLILLAWTRAYPTFMGEVASWIIPLIGGLIAAYSPIVAVGLTAGWISLLFYAISPLLGCCGFIASGVFAWQWRLSKVHLDVAMLPLFAIPLSYIGAALAIPLAFGLRHTKPRQGALVGATTFLLLSIWGALQGSPVVGTTAIIDPLQHNPTWLLQETLTNVGTWSQHLLLPLTQPLDASAFLIVNGTAWTQSIAPVLGLLLWGGMGALATHSRHYGWLIVLFGLLHVVLIGLTRIGDHVNLASLLLDLLLVGLLIRLWLSWPDATMMVRRSSSALSGV